MKVYIKIICFIFVLIVISAVTTLIYQNTQQADINYYQGHRLFEKGEFAQATEFYEKALAIKSSRIDVLRDLAYSYQWTKVYEKAIITFQKILSLQPHDNKIKESLAQSLSWQKEYDKAIQLYKEVVTATDNIDVKKQLAEVYIWNNQFEEAKEILIGILKITPEDKKVKLLLARAMQYSGQAEQAIKIYKEFLKEENSNEGEIRALLAEAYIADGDYESAAAEYREVLKNDPKNIKARTALADILGWNKKYDEALELYDEILKDKESSEIRLQKARILGWARKYEESIKEYRKILEIAHDEQIALEMRAKKAYWDNRVKHAINYYKELIEKDSQNVEAMFDLSQIYSYQSMWEKAIKEYKRILTISPAHFRAKEGLQKAQLISTHLFSQSGYEFFEADGQDRVNDIKRRSFFNKLRYPLDYNFQIDAEYKVTNRSFSDFSDVVENEGMIGISYLQSPDWRVSAFYDFIEYNKDIDTMHTFGGDFNFRVFDIGVSHFSFERERLENSSTVIRGDYYSDNYKERLEIDIDRRLKLGLDYLFSNYSDGNYRDEPGVDLLYYISLEPRRFSVKYRYFYRVFDEKMPEYFSPHSFWTNKVSLNWRHFLNKEEIFFGADDLYYDLGYDVSVDSGDIVGHKFSAGLNWDVNKRLNFNVQGSITNTSCDIYKDSRLIASIKYYF